MGVTEVVTKDLTLVELLGHVPSIQPKVIPLHILPYKEYNET